MVRISRAYLRLLIYGQLLVLAGDLMITIFAFRVRHDLFNSVAIAVCQFLLLLLNLGFLFVGFINTFPFKAGLIGLMFQEFKRPLAFVLVYFISFALFRCYSLYTLSACDLQSCDIWNPALIALNYIFHIASIAYYIGYKQAIFQICDQKYYGNSEWLQQALQSRRK